MKSGLPLFLFCSVSAIHLAFVYSGYGFPLVTKPLLILILLWYYLAKSTVHRQLLVYALLACWAGDCLLMFTDASPNFFLAGLTAFLTGHLLYIFCFRSLTVPAATRTSVSVYLLCAVPVAFAGWLIVRLWPGLGSFQVPVVMYTLVIAVMFIHAARRLNRANIKSFVLLLTGAFLFMVSDSLLAFNMFGSPLPFAGLLIMSTYLAAQYLIVRGVLAA